MLKRVGDLISIALAALLAAPAAASFAGLFPLLRFTRERIEITVHMRSIDVDGLYLYENPLPVPWTQGLSVPFPSGLPAPASVRVESRGEELPVRWILGKPYFTVAVPAGSSAQVRVRFTQRAPGRGAYLLTTTQPWGRPLERGEYLLRPAGVRIEESNYPLQFTRERFMPAADWIFRWSAP